MMRRATPSAVLMSVLAGSATAQPPITTTRIDNGSEHHRSELALRASPSTNDIIAVWHENYNSAGFSYAYYNVSTNGRDFRTNPGSVPIPTSCWSQLRGVDPTVAFASDGTGYVGYLGEGPQIPPLNIRQVDRMWIAAKAPGAAYASAASPVICPTSGNNDQIDKDVLAVGPPRDGTGDLVAAFFVKRPSDFSTPYVPVAVPSPAQYNYCTTSATPTVYDMGDTRAPNAALILRGGGSTINGRWIVGQFFASTYSGSAVTRAGSAYSDDEGQTWTFSATIDPTKSTLINNTGVEDIDWRQSFSSPLPAYFFHNPIIAADPNDPSKVYMVFTGHSPSEGSAANIDIYIAKSTDGGANFSGASVTNEGQGYRVVRLTDSDLGDTSGAVQFHPCVIVDDWGAIHVSYYVGVLAEGQWTYKVKLAHIPSISFTQHPTVSTIDLTPYSFTLDDSSVYIKEGRPFVGDYMNSLDARGCQVIAGYIAPPEEGGPVGVFVTFALIPNTSCVPDPGCYANCDGSTVSPLLTANDFLCFIERYAEGASYANCDGSTGSPALTANDFICFMNQYVAGCS